MGQKQKKKIEWLFFENPEKRFYLREIARATKIPKTTVARMLKELKKDGIISKEKNKPFDYYKAFVENPQYKRCKKIAMIEAIYKSGLIDNLVEQIMPKSIILFGSMSKGEYDVKSDIDLFVQAQEENFDLRVFEKRLKHKINLFFEKNPEKLSNELLNNIINGNKLYGFMKLR